MSLPPMTPELRAAALAKAAETRAAQSALRSRLKSGEITLEGALEDADAAGIKVSSLLRSLPGVGQVRAARAMDRHGIAGNRRVRGLGSAQRKALTAEFDRIPA